MAPSDTRLKRSEIKAYREQILREQRYTCPLCGTRIKKAEATLDHDHGTGRCRRVLHRSCNQAEGRILSWIKRSRSRSPKHFLNNLAQYWNEDYTDNPFHPDHLDEKEKEIKKLTRKLRRLKSERHKQKVRDEIKRLRDE